MNVAWGEGPRQGQGGFTLLEAVLSLVVVSVAIISIAGGLLVSARSDSRSNAQQRANLALTTFSENLPYVQASCPAVSAPAPTSASLATAPASHARQLLSLTLNNPEVQEWVNRGMLYRVTSVEYARWQVSTGAEQFSAACNSQGPTSPNPLKRVPYYPVIRVTVEACFTGSTVTTVCDDGAPVVQRQIIKRGGRDG